MNAWWSGLSQRERILIGVAAALLGGVLYLLALYRPLQEAAAAAERRAVSAAREAATIEADAAKLAAAPQPAASNGANVRADVTTLAAEAGLTIARMQPEGDSALTVSLEPAPANLVLSWIARLSAERGIEVERLTIEKSEDRVVDVQATFAEGPR